MPINPLTTPADRLDAFVKSLISFKNPVRASRDAGYGDLASAVAEIAAQPGALAGLKAAHRAYIQVALVPEALKTVETILKSKKSTDNAKIMAAKHVTDLADYHGSGVDSERKTLAEMSPAELQDVVDMARAAAAEKANRARPVIDAQPDSAQGSAQRTKEALDIIG